MNLSFCERVRFLLKRLFYSTNTFYICTLMVQNLYPYGSSTLMTGYQKNSVIFSMAATWEMANLFINSSFFVISLPFLDDEFG